MGCMVHSQRERERREGGWMDKLMDGDEKMDKKMLGVRKYGET